MSESRGKHITTDCIGIKGYISYLDAARLTKMPLIRSPVIDVVVEIVPQCAPHLTLLSANCFITWSVESHALINEWRM